MIVPVLDKEVKLDNTKVTESTSKLARMLEGYWTIVYMVDPLNHLKGKVEKDFKNLFLALASQIFLHMRKVNVGDENGKILCGEAEGCWLYTRTSLCDQYFF